MVNINFTKGVTIVGVAILTAAFFGWYPLGLSGLKWIGFAVCLYLAWHAERVKSNAWFTVFMLGAVTLNPLFTVFRLSRGMWEVVDLILALVMTAYIILYYATYFKGVRFERRVSRLFPDSEWSLIDRTKDWSKILGRRVESDRNPDFTFRHRSTNKVIAVECKYRSYFVCFPDKSKGIIWNRFRGQRYQRFSVASGMPVHVILGVGKSPAKPEGLFVIPLVWLQEQVNDYIAESVLKKWERTEALRAGYLLPHTFGISV